MSDPGMPVGAQGQRPAAPRSVFITGAGGFIGQALLERYRAAGAEVRGMDLRADLANGIVAGDLARPGQWAEHARGCELFINTAAVVSLAAPWEQYRRISVDGVRHCLDVAIDAGARRFVQFSSIAALGWRYPQQADERCAVVIGERYRYGVAKGGQRASGAGGPRGGRDRLHHRASRRRLRSRFARLAQRTVEDGPGRHAAASFGRPGALDPGLHRRSARRRAAGRRIAASQRADISPQRE
ncbi:TPA: NAD-dependent epimerase/dehydratase family protein [Pseudomonas aeruginosa]|nr:NAD-dependent epimerase/dehydratase family protein [Pseudomonas aeruginosa]